MTVIRVPDADTELSRLIDRVEAGEEIVLVRDKAPVARLVPVEVEDRTTHSTPRRPGRLAHLRDKLPSDLFLEPISEDELDAWEGKYSFPGDNGQ
jgi:antitoxin (DNA-binding transcriptional repressor) of toxin-antitoxin stability system